MKTYVLSFTILAGIITLPLESRRNTQIIIPLVTMEGNILRKYVQATLQGSNAKSKKVIMLVDTGAEFTLIDQKTATLLNVERVYDLIIQGVTGNKKGWMGRIDRITIGSLSISNWYVLVNPDYTGQILLGMDIIQELKLTITPTSLQTPRKISSHQEPPPCISSFRAVMS
jgi:clan AA aspartic protease (TIGR02281 family)